MFEKPTGGGDFFKAADHLHDLAILLEPKKILKDQPHEIDGIKSKRDIAICDMAFFRNSADIEAGKPSLTKKAVQVTSSILVSDIESNDWLDKMALVVVKKPKRAYVWRTPDNAKAEEAVGKYVTSRDATVAENLNDVPDFD